jgi:hypothetical protein
VVLLAGILRYREGVFIESVLMILIFSSEETKKVNAPSFLAESFCSQEFQR